VNHRKLQATLPPIADGHRFAPRSGYGLSDRGFPDHSDMVARRSRRQTSSTVLSPRLLLIRRDATWPDEHILRTTETSNGRMQRISGCRQHIESDYRRPERTGYWQVTLCVPPDGASGAARWSRIVDS